MSFKNVGLVLFAPVLGYSGPSALLIYNNFSTFVFLIIFDPVIYLFLSPNIIVATACMFKSHINNYILFLHKTLIETFLENIIVAC